MMMIAHVERRDLDYGAPRHAILLIDVDPGSQRPTVAQIMRGHWRGFRRTIWQKTCSAKELPKLCDKARDEGLRDPETALLLSAGAMDWAISVQNYTIGHPVGHTP